MKVDALRKIIKETVKEAIQEELKDMLFESFKNQRSGGGVSLTPPPIEPKQPIQEAAAPVDRQQIREGYMNVLGDMKSQFTTGHVPQTQGVQVNGPMDTAGPNGKLPEGEVSLDQVMGLMSGK